MNIFVLNTGRCGSTTFIQACRHISNYTSAHESRSTLVGEARLAYPDNHIEADNRLSWILGRLDRRYGDDAVYVHLRRHDQATAHSFTRRYDFGIIKAYREGILLGLSEAPPPLQLALDYCETVNSNIEMFLKDKPRKMVFQLENAERDFRQFWQLIGAKGDLTKALGEFKVSYNASNSSGGIGNPHPGQPSNTS